MIWGLAKLVAGLAFAITFVGGTLILGRFWLWPVCIGAWMRAVIFAMLLVLVMFMLAETVFLWLDML